MSTQTVPARGVAEQVKGFNGFSTSFLHLFDEQWFFYNALSGIRIIPNHVGLNNCDLATGKLYVQEPTAEAAVKLEKTASPSARQLLRTPSIQPPRASEERNTGVKEEPVSAVGRKLSYSYSTMDAPQKPILYPSKSKSMGRTMQPSAATLHHWCANGRFPMPWEASYRKGFQNKKWRSLGDLEAMELKGFKDLGFIFDDVEGLSSRLIGVAPSSGERQEKEEDGRIYLPETWFTQRSAPMMILRQVHRISGEEMKEQLRFWARAVACNVWGR